jgi:hypothetical protein
MKTLTFYGTFFEEKLRDEFFTAFPTLRVIEGDSVTEYLGLAYDGWMLAVFIADDIANQDIIDLITLHDPIAVRAIDWDSIQTARVKYVSLPQWATYTAEEAIVAVNTAVMNGWTEAESDAWIDANVTTLSDAKTALKLIGAQLIALRNINEKFAVMLTHLRDVVIIRSHE